MKIDYCVERLAANARVIEHLAHGVSEEQSRWKPSPDKWSLLEVVNHLCDEERDDFRHRLDSTLHRPGEIWSPIDPPGWARERRYNERAPTESLERFLAERRKSVEWLKGLTEPPLDNVYDHPQGRIRAGDLLASWVAHDLLHTRQMARLHWEYLNSLAAPYRTAYAGPW